MSRTRVELLSVCALGLLLASCSVEQNGGAGTSSDGTGAAGATKTIKIDGSSTVAPISSAMAEVYGDDHPDVQVRVNISGTTGGFDAFIRGETDINDASREIKKSEIERCRESDIEYVELKIGTDGLSVMVNKDNDWCDALTIDQLAELWRKDSPIKLWSDLNPSWPNKEIKLFGPDSKSGTYDYFKEVTVAEAFGKEALTRNDYQENTDDNVLATGIAGEKYALGYFGYAYYAENQDKLKVLGIAPMGSDVSQAVKPTTETIVGGTYVPLSRPLFIYVRRDALERPEVADFVKFYLSERGQELVSFKKYIRLNPAEFQESNQRLEEALSQELAVN